MQRSPPGVHDAWTRGMHLRVFGPRDRTSFVLGARPVIVGRDPSCDLVLEDPAVAPRHVSVHGVARGLEFHGLGAPVFLDGAPVPQGVVAPGHALQVGATTLALDLRDGLAPGPAKPKRRLGLVVLALVLLAITAGAAALLIWWTRLGAPAGTATATAAPGAAPAAGSGSTRGIEPLTFDRNPFVD